MSGPLAALLLSLAVAIPAALWIAAGAPIAGAGVSPVGEAACVAACAEACGR